MPSALPDKSSHLWDRVLDILRTQIHPQTFNTWFAPMTFQSCDDATCALTVPNAWFQDYLLDKGAKLLHPVIAEVFGAPRQISISIHTTESTSSPNPGPAPFDVLPACRLNAATAQDQWLIENLWMRDAVGILGGPPRAYKSWLALDMAVSVASGTPCLGTFPVPRPGPVLLYAAEDSASSLRARLESITRARHVAFDDLDVRVITADRLRLDQLDDQQRFQATVALHQPQIVILDPLVRIHGADENASNAVAALLGFFRALQRSTGAGILLIHHSRKNPSSGSGYSLRGSSDFYAWTDCFLSLERRRDQHQLLIEHRAAPAS
ncbi:MAG TPA: AAA family ATPase, partial [Candidatus Binatia bacterium]|nr:AAA family ATPase [Candidatus Binatia bacterium]